MGAKAQVLTQDLKKAGHADNRGQIIIKAETIQESNEIAHFEMEWTKVNNLTSGCLGMCQ